MTKAREHILSRPETHVTDDIFSAFGDKERYNDEVPTDGYLSEARKQQHKIISSFLDREVKKRGGEYCIGVSHTRRQNSLSITRPVCFQRVGNWNE